MMRSDTKHSGRSLTTGTADRLPHALQKNGPAFKRVLLGAVLAASTLAASGSWAEGLPDFQKLVESEGQAVVNIAVQAKVSPAAFEMAPEFDQLPEPLRRFLEQQQGPQGRAAPQPSGGVGSGFILSQDGYIMTNAHVVDNASDITVSLQDRRELKAELVGLDTATDIAVIKVDANELPTIRTADMQDVKVGEWVLAIGSPFGFEQSASQGIVSAVSRNLPDGTYTPFIQTDVAVNPGNSGGPLFNTDGEVIGVNSRIFSSTGGYQGLSFAIPIDIALHVADQLRETGHASRGWLGVNIQDTTPALARSFGLPRPTGALVAKVGKDSPAEAAGLKTGDIILEFNGQPVERSGDLPPLVGTVAAGESVPVKLMRNGKEQTMQVAVGEMDDQQLAMGNEAEGQSNKTLGIAVVSLDDAQRAERNLEHGVLVREVEPEGAAARAGVVTDDVIVSLAGKPVDTAEQLQQAASGLSEDQPAPMLVQRGDRALFLALNLAPEMG